MKNKTYIILSVAFVLIIILGTTLALVFYRGEETNVNLTVSTDIGQYINYVNGNATISGDTLNVDSDYTSGISTEIEFWKKEEGKNLGLFGHIYLDIDDGNKNLFNSPALKWAVVSDNILISEGNFIGYNVDDTIPILINHRLLHQNTKFKIFVWADENESLNASSGESFTVTVRCEASDGEYDKFGEFYEFDYTGSIEIISLKPGAYFLEVWGAQGGYAYDETYHGGFGGYSKGEIILSEEKTLYVVVGGKGNDGITATAKLLSGGYNGGGNSLPTSTIYTGTGGGATHIALVSGTLSSFANTLDENLNNILIVAGGGGGTGYTSNTATYGGAGGGYVGNSGVKTISSYGFGAGGTQSAGGAGYVVGSFGQGGQVTSTYDTVGGGGGFYGGGAGRKNSSGGGGSGYIGNSLLTNKSMYCYECEESTEIDTYTVSTTDVSETATSNYAKIGNGYARIIMIDGVPVVRVLERQLISFGENYDFKANIVNYMLDGYTVIYSTYNNASSLSRGEYQIRYIVKDSNGNEFNYYQKIEIV